MRLLLLLTIFFLSKSLSGQKVHVLKKSDGLSLIGKEILILDDKSASLTIKDILLEENQKLFTNWNSEIPVFNVTWSTIWMKMTFTTDENEKWLLYWGMPSVQHAKLYKVKKQSFSTPQHSGIRIPKSYRKMIGNNILFNLNLQKGDTVTYYLAVSDVGPLRAIIKVGTTEQFFQKESVTNFWHGAYYGIMMIMALYNLFLFVTNRKRVYLYYVLYVFSTTIFIAFFSGYVTYFPDWFQLVFVYAPAVFPALFGVFGMLFSMDFLNTKIHVPRMHRAMSIFCWMVILPILFSFFGEQRLSVISIQFMGLVLAIICIITGVKVWRKGYQPAKFYVWGFGAYMLCLFILIASDFSGTTSEFTSQQLLLIGSAIEAVMLSFAIGDKLNNANREKQQAQLEALKNAQENEKLIREQNIILEQKVKERTSEINEQKEIIEEKQKEIVDSINYAKRIQYSLLAHDDLLKSNLNDHFVLFQPKDIVSGDFYWATKKGDDFYLAVCDSTGHGVPGAFMSLLNISFLNEAITEKNISEPHLILNHVRERLIQNMESAQDGMDAILIKFEIGISISKVKYAAANNHPVLISNGELKELPADKMPVGKGVKMVSFALHEMELKKDDLLYLFTDGYADQFGGPKGKKFKYSNLSKLLLENHSKDLNSQSQILNQKFTEWKGDLEQVDDVCIIGISI